MNHELYTDADKDRPSQICDGSGSVCLALCKVCGQAEIELEPTCPGPKRGLLTFPDGTTETTPQDKTCTIEVHNVLGWDLDKEPEMINKAMMVAAFHLNASKKIDIYPQERVPADAPAYKNPGWLEWIVRCHYRSGGTLHIGVIQRQIGAEFECHS